MSPSDGAQPCDALGELVSTGDLLITSRGEILRACVTELSFWRARQIRVEPVKGGAHTYRPASMLVRVAADFDPRMPSVEVTRLWNLAMRAKREKSAQALVMRKTRHILC